MKSVKCYVGAGCERPIQPAPRSAPLRSTRLSARSAPFSSTLGLVCACAVQNWTKQPRTTDATSGCLQVVMHSQHSRMHCNLRPPDAAPVLIRPDQCFYVKQVTTLFFLSYSVFTADTLHLCCDLGL